MAEFARIIQCSSFGYSSPSLCLGRSQIPPKFSFTTNSEIWLSRLNVMSRSLSLCPLAILRWNADFLCLRASLIEYISSSLVCSAILDLVKLNPRLCAGKLKVAPIASNNFQALKFCPEFHFNLSQKQLTQQATNKTRKPRVTPARLRHSKLSLKHHALLKRNTYLQSQASQSSAPVLPREPTAVTIKQLRKDPTLSAHFSEEIEWLGSTSSESKDEGKEQKSPHGAQGRDKLKSGKTAKLTS